MAVSTPAFLKANLESLYMGQKVTTQVLPRIVLLLALEKQT